MILSKLKLVNFRNYSKAQITLHPKLNIFVGANAAGKTNILESIEILGLTKSHRIGNDSNLIKIGEKKTIVKGNVRDGNIRKDLEVELSDSVKKVRKNNNEIRRIADYISNLNVIVFSPDDIEIIKGSPSIRRNLINLEISQLSHEYLNIYNEYNTILKTRNEYLKILITNAIADKHYLDIITDKLIEKAVFIYKYRKKYIDSINKSIGLIYADISGIEGLEIRYEPNIEFKDYDDETIIKRLKYIYNKNYQKELSYGMTLVGPHRDDFSFYLGENNLKIVGSQGQQKLAVICYKLSEIPIFQDACGTSPVLLLDDIFSELDSGKKNKLLGYIKNDIQSILTTTDLRSIKRKNIEDSYIFSVKDGNVERRKR